MNYIKISLLFALTLFAFSCVDTQDDLVTANAETGGLITAPNKSLNYVVGDGASYSFPLYVHQNPDNDVASVNIWKSAVISTDAGNLTSNEVLAETIDVEGSSNITIESGSYDYAALASDLTIDGGPLPALDSELTIGDKFVFRIESVLADGNSVYQAYSINVAVSTRFAGTYNCTSMEYYRINALSTYNWSGETIVIESVDATTYKYTEWAPGFGSAQEFYFTVDADNNIKFPLEYNGAAQVLNSQNLINCDSNGADFASVDCSISNIVIKDDVNGKDQLLLTYGYYTPDSGAREFQETLTKK